MDGNQMRADPQDRVKAGAGAPHFLVHNEGDHVGVAVQDVGPGSARVAFMDSERRIDLEVLEDIPLGHKVALTDLGAGEEVIEYKVRIGLTRQPIREGEWVHVHNIRSARWEKSG
jgi:(2R)-sulfolactate sulfo-lyase subunit alpha